MRRFLIPMLLILALVCTCAVCAAEGNTLKFDRNVNVVFEGETLQTVLTREGEAAEGELTYASSNTKAATVDENGVVTGVAKGSTTITATVVNGSKTFRAQLSVAVARKAQSIDVDIAKLPLYESAGYIEAGLLKQLDDPEENALLAVVIPLKKNYTVRANVLPRDATSRRVVVTSDDEEILRVRGTTLTGLKPGETFLTIASDLSPDVFLRFRVLVLQPVSRIAITADAPSVAAGSTVALTASVLPEDASIPRILWESADERIATVDENGNVTGVKHGNARIVAYAADGSNVRSNISIKVTQSAQEITLDHPQLTVDVGRNAMLHATVLPRETDDKKVVWSSSDESVATVNAQGRVTGVSLGTCEITCASSATEGVQTVATVTVQQPVTKVTFAAAPLVYKGEPTKLEWTIEPANASNPALSFTSSNTRVLTVAEDGTVTGVSSGEAFVNAITTDGSNRRTRVKVKVGAHVTGATMRRATAYIDKGENAFTGAVVEPKDAANINIIWSTADEHIAKISPVRNQGNRVRITGVAEGETVVSGVTEDGGFPVSIAVKIGDWDHALKLTDAHVDGADIHLTVKNQSELNITSITAEVAVFDADGKPVPANSKDFSNVFKVVYKQPLDPDATTKDKYWQTINFLLPDSPTVAEYVVTITEYQVDKDWIKVIREKHRPQKKCPVHA